MLAFLPRAGRPPATSYATSNTVAFIFIAQHPTFSAKQACSRLRTDRTRSICSPSTCSERASSTTRATSVSVACASGYYCLLHILYLRLSGNVGLVNPCGPTN
eukprot:IDg22520t1